jgi:hypothetical protein
MGRGLDSIKGKIVEGKGIKLGCNPLDCLEAPWPLEVPILSIKLVLQFLFSGFQFQMLVNSQ